MLRLQDADKPDIEAIAKDVSDYEATVKSLGEVSTANGDAKIRSFLLSNSKSFLVTAKQLMRRIRDKVPYTTGDKMMINTNSGWMVEGSPQRLLRDYNHLINAYNRGSRI